VLVARALGSTPDDLPQGRVLRVRLAGRLASLRSPVGADIGFVGLVVPPLDFLPRVTRREGPIEAIMATRITSSETTMGMCMSKLSPSVPSSGRGLEGLRHAYSPPFDGAPVIV